MPQAPAVPDSSIERTYQAAVRCHLAREFARAEGLYRRILEIAPDHPEACNNLAAIRAMRRDVVQAIALVERAVRARPRYGEALNNLGLLRCEQREFGAAVEAFSRAVESAPGNATWLNNLGNACVEVRRFADAESAYDRAIALDPDRADLWSNRAMALRGLGRGREARASLERALAIDPRFVDAMVNLTVVLREERRFDEAAALCERALAIDPSNVALLVNFATLYEPLARFDRVRELAERALALDPGYAEAFNLLANCELEAGNLSAAETLYQRSIALDPGNRNANWNLAIIWLMRGEYARGWEQFEWRKRLQSTVIDFGRAEGDPWDGSTLRGRSVLVRGEQGAGDAIQFIRYAVLLHRAGAGRVVVEAPASLVALLRCAHGVDDVVARGEPLPPCDVHVELMSLPWRLGTTLQTVPADVPYFDVPARPIGREVDVPPGVRSVGIAWAGNPQHRRDILRSVDAARFAPLTGVPRTVFFSLQKGDAAEAQRAHLPAGAVRDLAPYLDDLLDAAAAIERLDLVITVDTSIAHLAGALGRPVWLLLPYVADYRWLVGRTDSPWYPTMRIFRQPAPGDWDAVFAEVERALRTEMAPAVGTGQWRAVRELAGELLQPDDLFIDLEPGTGRAALSALSSPAGPHVLAVIPAAPDAARFRRDASRIAPERRTAVAPSSGAAIERAMAHPAPRLIVRATRGVTALDFLAGLDRHGSSARLGALLLSERDPGARAATVAAMGDREYVPFTVDWNGEVVLDPLEGAPDDRDIVFFSAPLLRELLGAQEQVAIAEPSFRATAGAREASGVVRIGIDWELRLDTGWGVYGTNLALQLARTGRFRPSVFAADLRDLSPMDRAALAPVLRDGAQLARELQEAAKGSIRLDGVMLRALGNNFGHGPLWGRVAGTRNVGVIFFEDPAFDPVALERARTLDLVIAGSEWNGAVLRAAGLESVRVVQQGIDPTIFHPAPRSGLFGDRFVIFSGGKLEFRKGQDIVVAAFRRFRERHPEALLVTAWHNAWPQLIADLGLAGHVQGVPGVRDGVIDVTRWLAENGIPPEAVVDVGCMPNPLMGRVVREADAAVFTNRCEGGTNLVAMECMAAGVPTLVAANSGQRDLVATGGCLPLTRQGAVPAPTRIFRSTEGWGETDPAEVVEALERIWADREAAAGIARRGAEAMASWSWSRQVPRLLDALGFRP